MTFESVVRKKAEIDLDEIFVWYEQQKLNLGFDFIYEFEMALSKISRNPYHASYILHEARSISLKRFPYQIIYRVDEQRAQIIILAIAHHSRNPRWYRGRLKD